MTLISAVVPCFNEEESLGLFADELARVANGMMEADPSLSFELVLVDDGSSDGTLSVFKQLSVQQWPFTIRWLSFSRNFGKEAALYAGLKASRGDYVATMDADMQDPPSLLPKMYAIITEEDFDNVATKRSDRKGEPPIRSFFARMFYRIINKISDTEIVDGARDYRLMTRKMVNAVLALSERNRFSKGIFSWVGFRTKWLEYENIERVAGESKWNFFSLFLYSIEGIVGFSTAPLAIASYAGVLCSVIAVVFLVIILIRALLFGDAVAGWPSTMSVILLLGGLQMLFLGIIGQYLAKTYIEVKGRPLFIIGQSSDDE
ncbi:MAG: glycosyltransferase [Eggerthellaceae bacterium]|nr:glycosyltransferase [Eggerthellaceae bacterium]